MNQKQIKFTESVKEKILSRDFPAALKLVNNFPNPKVDIHIQLLRLWIGTETRNKELLEDAILLAEETIKRGHVDHEVLMQSYYNLGNACLSIMKIELRNGESLYSLNNVWRKAHYYLLKVPYSHLFFVQAKTNLGNLMDEIGRPIEAINYYEAALKKNRQFGMARGNKAMTIQRLAAISDYHNAYLIFAYKEYTKALKNSASIKKVSDNALDIFTEQRNHIHKIFSHQTKVSLDQSLHHPPRKRSRSKKFIHFYRNFCVENDLYLNLHLQDRNSEAAASDPIIIKPITAIDDENRSIDLFFRLNEVKESFIVARYLLAQSQFTNQDTNKISQQTIFINPYDYSVSNLYVGLLKSAYKEAIGTLDKVAIFLNNYLKLHEKEDHLNLDYRKIWYEKFKKENPICEQVLTNKNRHLHGLYSICMEINEIDGIIPKGLRNALTHRYLRVYKAIPGPKDSLTFEELTDITIELQYLVKCAIVSLINFVNENEQDRAILENNGKPIIQMEIWSDQMLDIW